MYSQTGELDFRLFDEGENIWDFHRGRPFENEDLPAADEREVLDKLGKILRQSRWRPSSRTNYNAWFRSWLAFCKPNKCLPIPAKEKWLFRFLTYLTLHYSVSTIKIAISAVIAIHRLNGFKSPIKDSMQLEDMIIAVEKCGIVGCRAPKLVVDASFVATVVEQFVERFPVFQADLFNPYQKGDSVRWLRSTGLVVLGIELGVRPSSLKELTLCCWQPRADGSVAVQVDLMKNGKNGQVFAPVLDQAEGFFADNCSAVSFFREYLQPFIISYGPDFEPHMCHKKKYRTAHCRSCPKLFQVFGKDKRVNSAIAVQEVSSAVKFWAEKLGRDKDNYSAVSLRRGSTSIAAALRVSRRIRKKHVGWRSDKMPDVYTEMSTNDELAVSKAVHRAVTKTKKNKHKKVMFRV